MIDRVFHDQGHIYFSPIEPKVTDEITIRLQAVREITAATALIQVRGTEDTEEVALKFEKKDKSGKFDLWKCVFPAREESYRYCFKVSFADGTKCYYDTYGENDELKFGFGFYVIPGFTTPDWSKGIFWYSVLPGAFYNGNVLNDKAGEIRDVATNAGDCHPSCSRHGGDLKGIIKKLDYIKELGVDALYINPIWTCKDAAGYGPDNFDMLDSAYCTDAELCELIDETHKRGLKFMMDAVPVFSTNGSNLHNISGEWPLPGSAVTKDCFGYDCFFFKNWPTEYQNYFASLDFDYSKDAAKDYMYRKSDSHMQRYLKEPYGIDAWRVDSSEILWGQNMKAHEVGADMKKYVKAIDPDKLFLAECYGDMDEGVWETCWNMHHLFNLQEWMKQFYDIKFFLRKMRMSFNQRCRPLALSMYNHFDNHDIKRLYPFVGGKHRLFAGIICNLTYMGSPTLYFGDETGDPDLGIGYYHNFDWNTDRWDMDFYYMYRTLAQLRRRYSLFKYGIVRADVLENDEDILVYGRYDESGAAVVVMNPHAEVRRMVLDVDVYEVDDGSVMTDVISGRSCTVKDGKIDIVVDAGGAVLVCDLPDDFVTFEQMRRERQMPQFAYGNNPVPKRDWTYKISTDGIKTDGVYGIMAGENEADCVFYTAKKDGSGVRLGFGRCVGGERLTVFDAEVCDGALSLQLQRIGTRYSAVYKIGNGQWQLLGDNLFANYSDTHVMLFDGTEDAFSLRGFGNTAEGGKAKCAPIGTLDFDGNLQPRSAVAKMIPQRIVDDKANYSYINGGLLQSSSVGESAMMFDKALCEYRLNAVLSKVEGTGDCGVVFGADRDGKGGWRLSLDGKGGWELTQGGKVVESGPAIESDGFGIRVIVERFGGKVIIYLGHDTKPALCKALDGAEGYIGFYSDNAAYKILDYSACDIGPALSQQSLNWEISEKTAKISGGGSLGLKGNAYSRFEASVDVEVTQAATEGAPAFAGILVACDGFMVKDDGLFFAVTDDKRAVIMHRNKVINEKSIEDCGNIKLSVIGRSGNYRMLLNGTQVLSVSDSETVGGAPALAAINAKATFNNFTIKCI